MARRPEHRRGNYSADAKQCTLVAYANPATRCMAHCTCGAVTFRRCRCGQACGRTLAEHDPTKTGKPPTWDAGHALDGVPGSALRPEVASCGRAGGACITNSRRDGLAPTRAWGHRRVR